jgi:hypothetical protein
MTSGIYDRKGWKGNRTSFKKGQNIPTAFKKGHSLWGENSPRWKGGKYIREGYIFVLSPNHPYKNNQGYVREHRLVMEAHLGRTLLPIEVVHHINGDKTDNRIENLMLFANNKEHIKVNNKTGINWYNKEEIKEYRKKNKEKIKKYNKEYYSKIKGKKLCIK